MVLQKTQKSKKGYSGSKGKTVYAHMGIWKKGDAIHITVPKEESFHTSVNNKSGSVRCHKNLYTHLMKLLQKNNCWE